MCNFREIVELSNRQLATYEIVYALTANYNSNLSITEQTKNSFTAQRFEQFNLQNNLIFVDMLFPNILADICLEVLLGKASNVKQYLEAEKTYTIASKEEDVHFVTTKIEKFVQLLLFSDIQQNKPSSGGCNPDLHYKKVENGIAQYYSLQHSPELIQFAFTHLRISIQNFCIHLERAELQLTLKFGFD